VAALVLAVLVKARSATGLTVKVPVTGLAFEPNEVVKEPAGIMLAACGDALDVTTTDTEQLELGGRSVPLATVKVPCPAFATKLVLRQVLVALGVVAFNMPTG
jgi:hypothetical protein